jgi:hypothetical protein
MSQHETLRSALAQLLDVCKRMDGDLDADRPDEDEYQQALHDAKVALDTAANGCLDNGSTKSMDQQSDVAWPHTAPELRHYPSLREVLRVLDMPVCVDSYPTSPSVAGFRIGWCGDGGRSIEVSPCFKTLTALDEFCGDNLTSYKVVPQFLEQRGAYPDAGTWFWEGHHESQQMMDDLERQEREWARRAAEAQSRAAQAYGRLMTLAETGNSGQTRRVVGFLASTYNGEVFPFDLFELRAVDIAISDDMLACLDALRWAKADLYKLVPDGDRRVRTVIARAGMKWPDES